MGRDSEYLTGYNFQGNDVMRTPIFTAQERLAPVVPDAIYPMSDFMNRTGLAKAAVRAMRRTGLTVRKIGRRSYVLGRDFHEWFEEHAEIVGSA
jgi:hypothetical protein